MDVKQETSDSYQEVVKTDQDASCRTEGNDWCSTEQSVNVGEIKQEIADLPTKTECDSMQVVSTIIKNELDVDIGDTKAEVSDYVQVKNESELLTTYCDLPTLKSEDIDSPDYYVQPCSSKHTERTIKTLRSTLNISKKRKKTYPCLVCQKNFPSPKSRSKHTDGHFGKRIVVCEFCGKLVTKIDFFLHCINHIVKDRPRKVSSKIEKTSKILCESKSGLQKHLKIIHRNEKHFKCEICNKTFISKYNLKRHLKNNTNDKHVKKIHTGKKTFKCNICSKQFHLKSILRRHLIIHNEEKSFRCDTCSKQFNYKSGLKLHMKTHTIERPYMCDICPKKFYEKSYLHDHLLCHTNKKEFKCNICFKEFKRSYELKQHLTIHSNEVFKCEICSKELKTKRGFRQHTYGQHLIIHSNEPFKCEICGKKCKTKWGLHNHSEVHTNEKDLIIHSNEPFKCEICAKEFKTNRGLRRHSLVHSNEKPFRCDECFKEFKVKTSLQRHILNIHIN